MKYSVQYNRAFRSRVPASRDFFAIFRIWVFLLVWTGIFDSALLHAQVTGSAAFLPGVYLPMVGMPDEIDTLCGTKPNQQLGVYMVNIGPSIMDGYGSLVCSGFNPGDDTDMQSFASGPAFNLNSIQLDGRLNFPFMYIGIPGGEIIHIGPIHTSNSRDIVVGENWNPYFPIRIYWEGDDGTYDSSRYTDVLSKHELSYYDNGSTPSEWSFGHFKSDTVEDIMFTSISYYGKEPNAGDTVFFNFTTGGDNQFHKGKQAFCDSIAFLSNEYDSLTGFGAYWNEIPGDFRGTGRSDIVTFGSDFRSMMYLRNDPPFSLQRMASQWRDTILSDFPDTSLQLGLAKSFQALVHLPGDSADDLLLWCGGDGRTGRFSIFRGNPDFGSHRLTLDSAMFNLWHPSKYDSYF